MIDLERRIIVPSLASSVELASLLLPSTEYSTCLTSLDLLESIGN